MVYALYKWLISISSKTTSANNLHICTDVAPEGLYVMAVNDVNSYRRSAANRVHATDNVVDSPSQNDHLEKYRELLELAISKFTKT